MLSDLAGVGSAPLPAPAEGRLWWREPTDRSIIPPAELQRVISDPAEAAQMETPPVGEVCQVPYIEAPPPPQPPHGSALDKPSDSLFLLKDDRQLLISQRCCYLSFFFPPPRAWRAPPQLNEGENDGGRRGGGQRSPGDSGGAGTLMRKR